MATNKQNDIKVLIFEREFWIIPNSNNALNKQSGRAKLFSAVKSCKLLTFPIHNVLMLLPKMWIFRRQFTE